MKDGLGPLAVSRIANCLEHCFTQNKCHFDKRLFELDALKDLENNELKQRVKHIISVLRSHFPEEFDQCEPILRAVPLHWDAGDPEDPLRGFAAWPLIDFVSHIGIDAPKAALDLLKTLTPLFSAEFAIRDFLIRHTGVTLEIIKPWLDHPDEHVRRLVSEGTRPRLPWGQHLKQFVHDPKPILPLLDALITDPSLYVRRSVANNLNDIGKDHPSVLLDFCQKWLTETEKASSDIRGRVTWVVGHATRSLVKQGHPRSFPILGYTAEPKIRIDKLALAQKSLCIGESLEFCIELTSLEPNQRFVLDYAIHYRKANGKLAPKVFKLKNCAPKNEEKLTIRKSQSFKLISTRKFHVGEHILAAHINGVEFARATFLLAGESS